MLAVVAVPGFFGNNHRELIVLTGILVTAWLPTLPLPRIAQRLIAPVAGASLYI